MHFHFQSKRTNDHKFLTQDIFSSTPHSLFLLLNAIAIFSDLVSDRICSFKNNVNSGIFRNIMVSTFTLPLKSTEGNHLLKTIHVANAAKNNRKEKKKEKNVNVFSCLTHMQIT